MPFKRVTPEKPIYELTPLDVTCTDSKCDNGLHCFKLNKALIKKYGKEGVCRKCGIDLVDWLRIHQIDLNDVNYTFKMLKKELVRHVYWHTEIKYESIKKAIKMGRIKLRELAEKTIMSNVVNYKYIDGMQTPKEGSIVNYAQHATATCCKTCIEYWYNIPKDTHYSQKQINFFINIIMLYIDDRIDGLTDNGQ